jgi:hypothetical protein
MKKILVALCLVLVVVAMVAVPVAASTNQNTDANQIGIGNYQNTESTQNNYDYNIHDSQTTGAIQTGGSGNTQVTMSNEVVLNGGTYTPGESVISNYFIPAQSNTYDNSLPLSDLAPDTPIATLYTGQVISLDIGWMNAGDRETMSWQSGMPILVEPVLTSNVPSALTDKGMSPVYDTAFQKYQHGGLQVFPAWFGISINEGFSKQNTIVFTPATGGFYSFIVDTRPSQALDSNAIASGGNVNEVGPNTIDFSYAANLTQNHITVTEDQQPAYIGVISTMPSLNREAL